MTQLGALIALVAAVWAALAGYSVSKRRLSWPQAFLYAPFKIALRISDRAVGQARDAQPPLIYAVSHRSRIDPALMLSLLPADTLHILDETSARAAWLGPWRELARTIAFNARHVFVSRRLVRRLRGQGRIAVYFPHDIAPGTKEFRLFRAVARIAARSEARIVALAVNARGGGEPGWPLAALRVNALPAVTLAQLLALSGDRQESAATVLYGRVNAARVGQDGEEPVLAAA